MIQPLTADQLAALQRTSQVHHYRVQLGHVQVDVDAADAQEALRHGRKRLCVEFPRLWDLIQSTPDARFTVLGD